MRQWQLVLRRRLSRCRFFVRVVLQREKKKHISTHTHPSLLFSFLLFFSPLYLDESSDASCECASVHPHLASPLVRHVLLLDSPKVVRSSAQL